ncbi:DNA/RNA non-specific endonuclease [Paraburkholderia caballeronis]|uniref:Endonuclease n=1 Tax=Paraburkholderia caballeronis TaxID=416943 RepID=A0A1H7VRL6_9BURK|nr:DNA/RNA non-specific endonuclease [Paraburkholderia caballeronis]PXW15495.1 endonuclease G [Paraburkholderia caballeronis]PXW93780.1 endonuclease G [Paraburkholderia caballeronis]RAJ89020.1 endonuclease G [Paraburkholderia caballeronis]SED99661.1 endonuclease G [Paraburkholderia caballeronis]SEM11856.1 endonuclease G [Paraburkholderia caballeronis]
MKKLFACLLMAAASHVFAAPPCSRFVPDGQFPTLSNARMAPKTRVLCYADFVVLHSGVTHGPLWSAEHLTRDHLDAAKEMTRTNRFFEDDRLPPGEGATLADYRRSGFDRGHMSPAGNRWNPEAMAQSFSLANIVPQNRENNQRLWSRLETAVRRITSKDGDAYVVTGPLFSGSQLQTIGASRVFVPTQLFKVVYVPSRRVAFAIVADNVSTNRYDIRTVHELEAASGIRFPGIPENLKDQRPGGLKGV